jgi:biofilm PGA synthesis N-glycosyltransferase PgaC
MTRGATRIVVIIAAHNEELSLAGTLRSIQAQERLPDRIVVAADNCSDQTVAIARGHRGIRYFRTRANRSRKPGALNQAWRRYCAAADLVICIDADTVLPPNAIADWEREFDDDPTLGGCSAKFTMLVDDEMNRRERLLVSLQRAEFAKWTDVALRRRRQTSVLAGTACCYRSVALKEVVELRKGDAVRAPWVETSLVEDFELTFRLRELGWSTKVSATVRAYTDAMTDVRSLWAQRMKWQTGTVAELLDFGVNRLTAFDWWQQFQGLVAILVRVSWVLLTVIALMIGHIRLNPWLLIPPVIFVANDVRQSFRIPHRTTYDQVIAALLLPQEIFAWMRAGWFAAAWLEVLSQRWLHAARPDRWGKQAVAEQGRRVQLVG